MVEKIGLAEGQRRRDEAIEVVGAHASVLWKMEAEKVIRSFPRGTKFTTDRVHFHLDRKGLRTREPRALGAVMQKLAREGVIAKTSEYHQSTRPECHARPIPVWERL